MFHWLTTLCWIVCSHNTQPTHAYTARHAYSNIIRLFFGPWCLPSWCSGWSFEMNCIPFLGSPRLLLVCDHSAWLSVFSWFLPCTPLGNPYRGSRTPLLSASVLGSCSSPALVLFSEFSLVWRQALPPEGHRPLQSSRLAIDVGGAQYIGCFVQLFWFRGFREWRWVGR